MPLHIFLFAVCLLVLYMCAQARVGHVYLLTTFGLFTEISVGKFVRILAVVRPETFLFWPLYVFIHFLHLFVRRIGP